MKSDAPDVEGGADASRYRHCACPDRRMNVSNQDYAHEKFRPDLDHSSTEELNRRRRQISQTKRAARAKSGGYEPGIRAC